MRKRYVYALLFGLPGLLVAAGAAFALLAGAAGFFWLYVFGDDAWPSSANDALLLVFVSTFVVVWGFSLALGFTVGKRLEQTPGVDVKHVAASVGLAATVTVLMTLHQCSAGNIGPRSDGEICSDYCRAAGYAASGMPPRDSGARTCTCFDGRGKEALSVSIEQITAND